MCHAAFLLCVNKAGVQMLQCYSRRAAALNSNARIIEEGAHAIRLPNVLKSFPVSCPIGRSMANAFADTTRPATTASAVPLSTMTCRGRRPTASWVHHTNARVSDGARKSKADWEHLHVDTS